MIEKTMNEEQVIQPHGKVVYYMSLGLTIGFVVFAVVSLIALIGIIIWVYVGSIAFDEALLCGPSRSNCFKYSKYNTPFNFTSHENCPFVSGGDFSQYFPDKTRSDIREIEFSARDNDWKNPKLRGYFYNYDNMTGTAPAIIAVHGFRVCKEHISVTLPAAMLYNNGFNVFSLDLRNHGASNFYDSNYSPPITTFGSEEHKDVLGLIDYISTRFPLYFQNRNYVGIYGVSMGGAISLISLIKEPKIKAAFVDSGVCNVRNTLAHVITGRTGVPSSTLMTGMCAYAGVATRLGCPEFPTNPLSTIESNSLSSKSIFFDHSNGDMLVPVWNAQNCMDVSQVKGANVTHHFQDTGIQHSRQCDDHVYNMLIDPAAYQSRLLSFFRSRI